MAGQHRRQVGVRDRGLRARHQPQAGIGLVAGGDVAEAGLGGDRRQPPLMRRVRPAVHQRDRAGLQPVRPRRGQHRPRGRLVERRHLGAVRRQPSAHRRDPCRQRRRAADVEREQMRPRLVADREQVLVPRRHQQQRGRTAALQQRVGGDRGAHPHHVDRLRRQPVAGRQPEQPPDPDKRRVLAGTRVLAQQLGVVQAAVRRPSHDVGEGATAIDPELPAPGRTGPGAGCRRGQSRLTRRRFGRCWVASCR